MAICTSIFLSGEWNHVALAWNVTTGSAWTYINGELVDSVAVLGKQSGETPGLTEGRITEAVQPGGYVLFGQEQDSLVGGFDELQSLDGVIDEFRVWNRALSQAQIAAHLYLQLDPYLYPGLDLYFSFNSLTENNLGKLVVPELTGSGQDGFYGHTMNAENEMCYATNRGCVSPTAPRFVASHAPLSGGPLIFYIEPGQSLILRLPASSSSRQALQISLMTAPNSGALYRAPMLEDAIALTAGEVIGWVMDDAKDVELVYVVPEEIEASWSTTFRYEARDEDQSSAAADVALYNEQVIAPADKSYHLTEDTPDYFLLGSLAEDGHPATAVITSLPAAGTLYHAHFGSDSESYYEIDLADRSRPILGAPEALGGLRGIVVYVPRRDQNGAADEPVISFTYRWRTHSGQETSDATVFVYLEAVNDPPTPKSVNVTTSTAREVLIQLESSDVDPAGPEAYLNTTFYSIRQWPQLGSLWQADGSRIDPEQLDQQVISQWVSAIPEYHNETGFPSFSSQYSNCDGCEVQSTCEEDCLDDSWHITQVIGPNDAWPEYADSKNGWDKSRENVGYEYGIFEFPSSLYVSAVIVYEVFNAGSITRISVASEWAGAATDWFPLWEGLPEPITMAYLHSPPLCPCLATPVKYVRLELNTSAVPGWNNIDALEMQGTRQFPKGRVSDLGGSVFYHPPSGFHSTTSSSLADAFEFTSTDCLDESPETARVGLILQAPEYGTSTLFTAGAVEVATHVSEETVISLQPQVEEVLTVVCTKVHTETNREKISEYCASHSHLEAQEVTLMAAPSNGTDAADSALTGFEIFHYSGERMLFGTGRAENVTDSPDYHIRVNSTMRDKQHLVLHMWIAMEGSMLAGATTVRVQLTINTECNPGITDSEECADSAKECSSTMVYEAPMMRCVPACMSNQVYAANGGCALCPAGSVPNENNTACQLCPPGTAAAFSGLTSCSPCQGNDEFSDQYGSITCTQCPSNSFRTDGHVGMSEDECVCIEGFYKDAGTLACEPCPTGAICYGHYHPPYTDAGYWIESKDMFAAASPAFKKCPAYKSSCNSVAECYVGADGEPLPGTDCEVCQEGYKGRLCSSCEEGYYRYGGTKCLPCEKAALYPVSMVLLPLLFTFLFFSFMRTISSSLASFSVCVNNLKVLAILLSLEVGCPWAQGSLPARICPSPAVCMRHGLSHTGMLKRKLS
ncbi:hypothetical protein CYMTET_10036 [Cymbomonas tetramitiformis]|uniref:Pentraxin (PTX) domain-containing protein n=1 Tax=Cymbomonas tetramitiformis TaxID=36881 RepID=A0AAE0LEV3_9CHLO|nr:hypothetical protein CYMTET_10036 [Cymbomonas tetramitiformis]